MKHKLFFGLKYYKLELFALMIILAYLVFRNPAVESFIQNLNCLSYLGVFIAGILFSFGFSAPFAVGFFLTLNPENLWMNVIIASIGSVLGDLAIFSIIKVSFMDEFNSLKKESLFRFFEKEFDKNISHKIRTYLRYAVIGFIIASPLPDEFGVALLAGLSKIKFYYLSILSFILHALGILALLWI